ncbi:ATP-binding protein [Magnetospirillum sp. SS-4]|uniref:sensor histidine kinase n=1 Tax=Magnetospirillum sp. SS-4 TaxID=2681465 RepID=UPI0015737920|nr:ATP-binding protein [Magnetospirillum sp. SS-4]
MLIALAALVPFVMLEVHYVSILNDRVMDTANGRGATLARSVALQHRAMIEAAGLALEQVALSDQIHSGSPDRCAAWIRRIRAESRLFANLARGTVDGVVDCSGVPGQARFIAEAMTAVAKMAGIGRTAVGVATISPNHGRPILPMATPLSGPDNRRDRVLVAGIDLHWLDRVIAELALNPGERVLVLDDRDTILAIWPSTPGLVGASIGLGDAWADLERFDLTLPDEMPRSFSATSFDGGIRIAVGTDQRAALAELDRARTTHLIGFGATAAGSVLLLVLIDYFGLGRRTKRFAKVAASLAAGDSSARLRVDGRDPVEFGRIADALNSMADAIAERDSLIEHSVEQIRILSRAVEQSPHMVIITDIDGIIRYVNPRFTEISGYPPDEAIGRPPGFLGSGDTPPEVYRDLWETVLCGRQWHGEIKDRRKDGSVFWAAVSIAPVREPGGALTHFVAMHEDITRRKLEEDGVRLAREQAEVASRAKSELLANMSHELRTPLNAIIGFSETMLMQMFGPLGAEKYQEYARDIHFSGQHLLELINDILDVSAIEAGKMELHEESVDIGRLLESSVRLVVPRAEKGGVTVRFQAPSGLALLWADARRMKQILLNLLSNAVKFTPEGGTVTVSARMLFDGRLTIQVKDTGIGMTRDEVGKAVTKFGQVDSSLARKHDGTGLGLPLTIGLVELHGGTLEISSEKGAGTLISIILPAGRMSPAPAVPRLEDA